MQFPNSSATCAYFCRYLDISHSKNHQFLYYTPEKTLYDIVNSLPKLKYLDISGTNLTENCKTVLVQVSYDCVVFNF